MSHTLALKHKSFRGVLLIVKAKMGVGESEKDKEDAGDEEDREDRVDFNPVD